MRNIFRPKPKPYQMIRGNLTNVQRRTNSKDGNPRWLVWIDGVRYSTEPDIADARKISPLDVGGKVTVHVDEKNHIRYYEVEPTVPYPSGF